MHTAVFTTGLAFIGLNRLNRCVCVTGFSVLCSDKVLPLSYILSNSVSGISWQGVNIAKLSFHGVRVQQYFNKQHTIKKNK